MTSLARTNLHMVRKPGQLQVAQPVPLGSMIHGQRASGYT
jgi:hypothetical protein